MRYNIYREESSTTKGVVRIKVTEIEKNQQMPQPFSAWFCLTDIY